MRANLFRICGTKEGGELSGRRMFHCMHNTQPTNYPSATFEQKVQAIESVLSVMRADLIRICGTNHGGELSGGRMFHCITR